ncbi:signal peptide peptidase SppA [Alteribacillus iranensis]|uniref:Protease-4 n=1 Tax=Alteribacillus iranensis TaxID=930128 RepID=A0A1I2CHZ6_9BACI|nr:signal peptide peptidase SppA [Alteribacillus iranensis]SFE67884.1 protease-4 [Alteribacillus iranensis]
MMSAKRWIALAIAAFLLIVSVGFQTVASIATADFDQLFAGGNEDGVQEKVVERGQGEGKIVILNLDGVIQDTGTAPSFVNSATYHHQQFLRLLDRAGEDNTVSGVILRVNTPGGGVVESDEIHDKVKTIQEEFGKPVYVSMGNTAASGGYYVSAPADKIVAHPATVTGSIGVIMQSINYSELADNIGLEFNTLKSGEYKDIMAGDRPMTEEEEEILQSMVDDFYGDFVNIIAEGRGMDEQTVREIGDGRVYSGTQAHEVGLVDDLGTLEDTITMMKEDLGLDNPLVTKYQYGGLGFNQFIGATARSLMVSDSELLGIKEILMDSETPRAMYLYTE